MDQKGNNAINNYKGVMLCSRPNENILAPIQKPFCGRVFPHEQIGLIPPTDANKIQINQQKKPKLEILKRHKKWLKDFQNYKNKEKQEKFIKIKVQQQKFKKIKEQAQEDRERSKKMRNQYNQTATNVINILDDKKSQTKPQLTKANLKKLDQLNQKQKKQKQQGFKKKKKVDKPLWAQTQEQVNKKEEQEVNQLLNFFENTQITPYSEDQQVKEILKNLKQKINQLKQSDNWRQKQVKKFQKQKQQKQKNKIQDDKYSNFSVHSQSKSIASQKTQKKIQQLRQKAKQQQDWDKFTASSKHSHANIQQKIAKNLADEVLRNYPNLKGVHSNSSIRKLLQSEATKAINQPISRPVITTVVKQKKPLDTNNLPYLHRNPAI